jgi:hypothetical protein
MRNLTFISIFILLCSDCALHASSSNQIQVTDVSKPVICLNGIWKFNMNPPVEFWKNDISPSNWPEIEVPGECAMQGFAIRHDRPYAYKTSVLVPTDYKGKTIILKFEGVYS